MSDYGVRIVRSDGTALERPEVLTIPEAAAVLRIHPTTLYRKIADGESPVPIIKIGRKRLVSRVALDRLLAGEVAS